MGGNCLPSLLIPTATLAPTLATVDIPTKTAHQQQRRCRHTGCRHHPRAPNCHDEAPPSNLLPLLGGTTMMMMPSLPKMMTSCSLPSHQPFKGDSTTSVSLGGSFASNLHLQPIRIRRRSFLRLCGTRHGPCAPNLRFPIVRGCGRWHRPRAPNPVTVSDEIFGIFDCRFSSVTHSVPRFAPFDFDFLLEWSFSGLFVHGRDCTLPFGFAA